MKPRPVVCFHVCTLELKSIFKMAAKFTLKFSIYHSINIIMNRKQDIVLEEHDHGPL